MATKSFLPAGFAPVDLDAWCNRLADLAEGLSMNIGDDRATYRTRVADLTKLTSVGILREVLFLLGYTAIPPTARTQLQRKIADQWIANIRAALAEHIATAPDDLLTMGDVESPTTNEDRQGAISFLLGLSMESPSEIDAEIVADVTRAEQALVRLGITAEELNRARRDNHLD